MPSPTFNALACPTKESTNWSVNFLLDQEARRYTPNLAGVANFAPPASARVTTSAVVDTMGGAWPPSSMVTRFMWSPARAASACPRPEPVNDIFLMTDAE